VSIVLYLLDSDELALTITCVLGKESFNNCLEASSIKYEYERPYARPPYFVCRLGKSS